MKNAFARLLCLCIIRMTIVHNIVKANVLPNLAHPTEMKQAVNMVQAQPLTDAAVRVLIASLVRHYQVRLDVNMVHILVPIVAAAPELAAHQRLFAHHIQAKQDVSTGLTLAPTVVAVRVPVVLLNLKSLLNQPSRSTLVTELVARPLNPAPTDVLLTQVQPVAAQVFALLANLILAPA